MTTPKESEIQALLRKIDGDFIHLDNCKRMLSNMRGYLIDPHSSPDQVISAVDFYKIHRPNMFKAFE